MQFENALNLVWVLVGVAALGAFCVAELRRSTVSLRSRCRRGVAVLVATVALFPCISASDDLVCLKLLNFGASSGPESFRKLSQISNPGANQSLALQLESLEHSKVSSSGFVPFRLSKVAGVGLHVIRCCDRPMPSRSGRAPPLMPFPG